MAFTEPLVGAAVGPVHAARSRACIVDPRLALSPLGLMAAARLSAECAVWVPRELRETARRPQAYLSHPDKLVPRVYGAHVRSLEARDDEVRDALGQWASALQGSLGAVRFFHLGEHRGESALPLAVDGGVHERFERLGAGLDAARESANYDEPRGEVIAACFSDAAALCAALAPYGAFILSTLEADRRGAPALCNYLDAWGVRVVDVTARAGADADVLRALLARAGLGPIEWSGVAFAAVHVVPPGLGLDAPAPDFHRDAWRRTHVFWHRIDP